MSNRFTTLAGLAAVAAIALTWSALAADGDGERDRAEGERWSIPLPPPPGGGDGDVAFHMRGAPAPGEGDERGGMMLPHPPPGGPMGAERGELTWGELHVQRDGEAVTLRVDHGEIAAVGSDSIMVSENDGNDVEIPIDDETDVFAGPFEDAGIGDLAEGDEVHVVREEGQPAEHIGVLPDRIPPMLERAPEGAEPPGEAR